MRKQTCARAQALISRGFQYVWVRVDMSIVNFIYLFPYCSVCHCNQTCTTASPYTASISTRQAYKVYADNGIASVCRLMRARMPDCPRVLTYSFFVSDSTHGRTQAPAFAFDTHVYNLQSTSEAFWGYGCPVTRSGVNTNWILTNLFVQVTLAVLVINAFACVTITGVLGYLEYRNLENCTFDTAC